MWALGHRWKFNLVAYYGHYQIRVKDYLSRVRHLKLPKRKLNVVNIKAFLSLEVLDLSNNNLVTIDGLEALTRFER